MSYDTHGLSYIFMSYSVSKMCHWDCRLPMSDVGGVMCKGIQRVREMYHVDGDVVHIEVCDGELPWDDGSVDLGSLDDVPLVCCTCDSVLSESENMSTCSLCMNAAHVFKYVSKGCNLERVLDGMGMSADRRSEVYKRCMKLCET